jgi:hypothetical protein
MSGSRLPETLTLAQILPKGTEGGKEFARIVDLLLFHEARRNGRTIQLFSDASGDFRGLDSFGAGEGTLRRDGTVGYQYKFYSSPFSDAHRAEIKGALKQAAEHQKELKLQRWILVTPEALTESAQRRDGGDVSWFQGLRKELDLEFEIEHWGHRQLQGLFLETPALCLFYYPDLVREGTRRQHTIADTRSRYDHNLLLKYRPIEFVGMSIYKQEATRGVPIEEIYIPLKLVHEGANSDDPKIERRNPLECLAEGRRTVLLGDPGSGKSTLLRFLALAGISPALQARCVVPPPISDCRCWCCCDVMRRSCRTGPTWDWSNMSSRLFGPTFRCPGPTWNSSSIISNRGMRFCCSTVSTNCRTRASSRRFASEFRPWRRRIPATR